MSLIRDAIGKKAVNLQSAQMSDPISLSDLGLGVSFMTQT
jgi:hypothetical protein